MDGVWFFLWIRRPEKWQNNFGWLYGINQKWFRIDFNYFFYVIFLTMFLFSVSAEVCFRMGFWSASVWRIIPELYTGLIWRCMRDWSGTKRHFPNVFLSVCENRLTHANQNWILICSWLAVIIVSFCAPVSFLFSPLLFFHLSLSFFRLLVVSLSHIFPDFFCNLTGAGSYSGFFAVFLPVSWTIRCLIRFLISVGSSSMHKRYSPSGVTLNPHLVRSSFEVLSDRRYSPFSSRHISESEVLFWCSNVFRHGFSFLRFRILFSVLFFLFASVFVF